MYNVGVQVTVWLHFAHHNWKRLDIHQAIQQLNKPIHTSQAQLNITKCKLKCCCAEW